MSLTWVRRLEICIGIAHALRYIHYDEPRNFSLIHRNIGSSNILLNDDWEPKLGNFLSAVKIKASERHQPFKIDMMWCTDYYDSKWANHKLDMYSFGIVLFELLCGWECESNKDNKFLTHFREKKFNEIYWDLWKQMDLHSFTMFSEIAYECLEKEQSQRPNIDDIVPRLEKALVLARENKP
ncbi:kinase-like domain, phloem protein 2-like protein, partial [Tanacetum coccineum]